ncbi:glycosyltransferase family 4 protein [Bacillota bacterium]
MAVASNTLTVGIFNDSFPPTIDGVANAAANYAAEINKHHGRAVVATPWYPNVVDNFPYKVVRYPSAKVGKKIGYRAGNPFDPFVLNRLHREDIDIIHTHSPFSSAVLARLLRFTSDAPLIFTYHTKFDIEFQKILAFDPVRTASAKFLLSNINASNEVWAVSEGAGKNMRSLGYEGDYIVMQNGTDFPKGSADPRQVDELRKKHHIDPQLPVFLFVGRMMWYKGIRLIVDSLKAVRQKGYMFRMIFVGEGYDRPEIQAYVNENGLADCCTFTGAVYDREKVRAYFTLADMFLFPSTYDTNGIVVSEAAACSCPSILIEGSCAAERTSHMETAILVKEEIRALTESIIFACDNPLIVRSIGQAASEKIYLSWEDAVDTAYNRYRTVIEKYNADTNLQSRRLAALNDLRKMKEEFGFRLVHLTNYMQRQHSSLSIKKTKFKEYYLNRRRGMNVKLDRLLEFYKVRQEEMDIKMESLTEYYRYSSDDTIGRLIDEALKNQSWRL